MTFDVIIATYNRPELVIRLAREVQACVPAPGQVIIVDSSDLPNETAKSIPGICYLQSSHKNQPYQRLLGASESQADVVVFLDDDVQIINPNIFQILAESYCDDQVVGVTVHIDYHSIISESLEQPLFRTSIWSNLINIITGVPHPGHGQLASLGVVGLLPGQKETIKFFQGPCMSFKRNVVLKIIPDDLLALYERKLGKGEDKAISCLATQFGILMYHPEKCLFHPAVDSAYFSNVLLFYRRTIYSRLYLSRIYAQVFKKPMWKEYLLYYWFTLWRLIIAIASWIIQPSKSRKGKLLGVWDGLWLSITLPQRAERLTPDINWQVEIEKDLKGANFPNV